MVGSLENTDFVMNQVFWVGVYPGITPPMLDYMIDTFHKLPKEHLVALVLANGPPSARTRSCVRSGGNERSVGDLRGQRVFITGGTGFVGTWLIETFVWANRQLRLNANCDVLSRNPEAFRDKAPEAAADPSVTFLQGSLSDFEIPADDYPFVIHAATDQTAAPTKKSRAAHLIAS